MIKHLLRLIFIASLAALTCACAHQSNYLSSVLPFDHSCSDMLKRPVPADADALDMTSLRFLSWNIQKGQQPNWFQDLEKYANDKDLILIQEASESMSANDMLSGRHWAFAPGYKSQNEVTGVATLSKVEPVDQCSLTTFEPWLGTPKATNVTRYALRESHQSLLVINIHMINFVWSNEVFDQQLRTAADLLEKHSGPVIVSGDFNTWRMSRFQLLDTTLTGLGLAPVTFAEDHRTRFFGRPVDHIYIGGLKAGSARTYQVDSSDHNPLVVDLSAL